MKKSLLKSIITVGLGTIIFSSNVFATNLKAEYKDDSNYIIHNENYTIYNKDTESGSSQLLPVPRMGSERVFYVSKYDCNSHYQIPYDMVPLNNEIRAIATDVEYRGLIKSFKLILETRESWADNQWVSKSTVTVKPNSTTKDFSVTAGNTYRFRVDGNVKGKLSTYDWGPKH